MKKLVKFMPLVLALCLLSSCNDYSTLKNKKAEVVTGGMTYQEIYENLCDNLSANSYEKDNLFYYMSKEILESSDNWTEASIKEEIHERFVEDFESYNADSYKTNGLIDEEKIALDIESKGYEVKKTGTAFKESVNDLVGYRKLYDCMNYDYSDYEEKSAKLFYHTLLTEEYILTERAGSSTNYYKNKDVRKVQYFKYTPSTTAEATKYAETFQAIIEKAGDSDLKTLVEKDGGLDYIWKIKQLDDLAKDFAKINALAVNGIAVNDDKDFPLPASYASEIKKFEQQYKDDAKVGYQDIREVTDATDKSEITAKLADYSASGTQSIYKGYYLKQIAILTSTAYEETVASSDGTTVIDSTINSAIADMDKFYGDTKFLDVYESGSAIVKSGTDYYIIYVEEITDSSSLALRKEAAKALAQASSNTRNVNYHYLTMLAEEGKLKLHRKDFYDYLNENYNFGEED